MRVVFRVDSSSKIGTGHVMRCITLAQILKKNRAKVEFICREHEGNIISKIFKEGFKVHLLEFPNIINTDNKLTHSSWLSVTQDQDANDCIKKIKSEKIDWLIVDHYSLDKSWHKKLKPLCKKIMVIDDLADRKHLCNILLDQNFGRKKIDYLDLVPNDCNLLMGSNYSLLRSEFLKWRSYSLNRRINSKFKSLLITMGGIDRNNLTEQILKELKNCVLPNDLNIIIVMGSGAPFLKNVKLAANRLEYKTEVKEDIKNIAEIMANADIAIGAAGSTSLERCCLGLPTIQIAIAKNQVFSAKMLASHNVVMPINEIKEIGKLLKPPYDLLKAFGSKASTICNGTGAYKVFNQLIEYKFNFDKYGEISFCNYINLNKKDKIQVLNMRNHSSIQRWMYTKSNISLEMHNKFIENLENDISLRYFVIKQKDKVIGSINFSKIQINKSVEFGIYTNPFNKSKGLGAILESVGSYYALMELGAKNIKLEVLSNNKRAIDFYIKCGYDNVFKEKKDSENLIYMQKKLTN
jgi:UDP-2,4-diacetamido-2,4,6-trideoxy-beta-L-altropyranose hydrolase